MSEEIARWLRMISRPRPPISKNPGPHYDGELAKTVRMALEKATAKEIAEPMELVYPRLIERYAYGHVKPMSGFCKIIIKELKEKYLTTGTDDGYQCRSSD